MEIIQQSSVRESVSWYRYFEERSCRGAGFMFDCDDRGTIRVQNEYAAANLAMCLANSGPTGKYVDTGIGERRTRWRDPKIGKCDECGNPVVLDSFTNTCSECYADYNMSGSRLAPRECWGEECGEQASDLLVSDEALVASLEG